MTSEPLNRVTRTPTDDELPALLKALEASGGNTATFAREHGLAPWKLYEARRLAAGGRQVRPAKRDIDLVQVHVVEERKAMRAPLELVLSSGHRLLIPDGFDEALLRRLLGVLSSC